MAADKERRRRALEAMIAQQKSKEKSRVDQRRNVARQRAAAPIWKRYEAKERQREASVAAIKAQEAAAELDGCTFAPAINERSRDLSTRRVVRRRCVRTTQARPLHHSPLPAAVSEHAHGELHCEDTQRRVPAPRDG